MWKCHNCGAGVPRNCTCNTPYEVTVNINVTYKVKAKDEEEARKLVENIELPSGYEENTFEIVNVEKAV